jgi:hypothetical protein
MTGVTPPPTGGTEMPGSMPAGGQITPLERDNSSLKLALPGGSPGGGRTKPPVLAWQPRFGAGESNGGAGRSCADPRRSSASSGLPEGPTRVRPPARPSGRARGPYRAVGPLKCSPAALAGSPAAEIGPLLRTPSAIGCLKRLGGTTDAGARAAAEGRSLRYAADLAKIVGDQTERFAILLHSGSL